MTFVLTPVATAPGTGAAHMVRSADAAERFIAAHADSLVGACRAMSDRFRAGGRLWAMGTGAQSSDAHHIAVEFAHPVIVGKRSLAAMVIPELAAAPIDALCRSGDIAVILAVDASAGVVPSALAAARRTGMLTVLLTGAPPAAPVTADYVFSVPDEDAMVVQEVHETAYHVLWELVHVFLEHQAP